jgi:predicted Zn-dependent protease
MKNLLAYFLTTFITLTTITGCAPVRQRLGATLVPVETEIKLGEQFAAQIEEQETVLRDRSIQAYVRYIADQLIPYSQQDRPEIQYRITVLDNPKTVNAFAVPGGHLYVYTGLLLAAESEAEVAGVMAHEIGHIVGRHSANQMAASVGLDMLANIALGEDPDQLSALAANLGKASASAGFSRDDEREADKYGVKYSIAAGYDPRGLLTFFEKLQALEGRSRSGLESLMASHPATEERIKDIEKRIAKAGNPSGKDYQERFIRKTAALRARSR